MSWKIHEFSCRKYKNNICALGVAKDSTVMMSFCSFHAHRCHGDKLKFINDGPCTDDLNWARFRARISEKSSVREPCRLDTCYEWETCTGTYALIRNMVHTLHKSFHKFFPVERANRVVD